MELMDETSSVNDKQIFSLLVEAEIDQFPGLVLCVILHDKAVGEVCRPLPTISRLSIFKDNYGVLND